MPAHSAPEDARERACAAGIHVLLASSMTKDVNGWNKSGHDGGWVRIITGLRCPRIRV
jgi:hypothetical protein